MSKKKKVACLAQKNVKLYLSYFYAHKNLKKRLFSSYMFLRAQKSRKAQGVKRFFFLHVLCAQKCCIFYLLMCICCFLCFSFSQTFLCAFKTFVIFICLCAFYIFYACAKTVFLFSYVHFVLFMPKQGTFLLLDVSMCI